MRPWFRRKELGEKWMHRTFHYAEQHPYKISFYTKRCLVSRKFRWLLFAWLVCFMCSPILTSGEETGFAKSADEIIRSLSDTGKDNQKTNRHIRLRSCDLHSVTPRGIKVIKKNEHGKLVNTTSNLPAKSHHVKLKIEFDFNSYVIRQSSIPLLRELAKALLSQPLKNKNFYIIGNTDSIGSNEYNLTLSFRRAQAVKDFLVRHYKVDSNHLIVMGCGENSPIASNETETGRQLNRRVEIVLQQ